VERATELTVLPDYIEPPPGIYVAGSNTQAYAALLAMVAAGDASLLGERYGLDGKRQIAVSIGKALRPNRGQEVVGYLLDVVPEPQGFAPNQQKGQIRIGAQFYAAALKDYSHDWPERWWREAVQNAVDAGARNVLCSSEQQSDGLWQIYCDDDGRGMDRETLIDKFLVLGGTTKVTGGTTGGFGKAKELLVLPWITWEIHTQSTIVRGAGIEYEVLDAPYREGTRLTVTMPSDKYTSAADASGFLKKCNIPSVRFKVNGERVNAELFVDRSVETFGDKAEIYYDEKNREYPYYMLVRTNGLYMFSEWLHNKPEGLLVMELLKPSVEILTANRDGLADRELKNQVSRFSGKLAIEAKEVLRQKEKRIRQKFRGTGKFEIDEHRLHAAALESLGTLEPRGEKAGRGEQMLSADQVAGLVGVLRQQEPVEEVVYTDESGQRLGGGGEAGSGLALRIDPELAGQLLATMALAGATQVETAVKQLSWEPDFYVVNELPGYNVPRKFFPEAMTGNVRKLARYWAELCRFVLIRLNCSKSYGIGFLFYPEHQAEHISEDDENWLMLNPFHGSDPRSDELFDLADDGDLARLFSLALHECTHMAYNVSEHAQDFATALTQAIAKTYGQDKQIRAIKRVVLAEEKKVTEKLRAGKPKRERKAKGAVAVGKLTGGAPAEQAEASPDVYGKIFGIKMRDPYTNVVTWEIYNDGTMNLFRIDPERAETNYIWQLLDRLHAMYDPDLWLSERAKQSGVVTRAELHDRWDGYF
jgi:hypothetical protein